MSNNNSDRKELHRAIWNIAEDLRGAVDGFKFQAYVLCAMFYRFLSENLTQYINDNERAASGDASFDYAKISDEDAEQIRDAIIYERGFFIKPSHLFANVNARANNDENLNETLDSVFRDIEASSKGTKAEKDFDGLFNSFDTNNTEVFNKSIVQRNRILTKLLNGIAAMPLEGAHGCEADVFGEAYEYLMAMYAANAGKSGGEYFTPAEVSELLTRLGTVGRTSVNKVYDPTCGSGSLLLKSIKVLGPNGVRDGFFGQELNPATYNLCRINMFLHGVDFTKFDIAQGDTLLEPKHWDDKPFELIVSNPPYSVKWPGNSDPTLINDPRFSPAGVLAPKGYADFAFIMHCLSWLDPAGTAAIVCFPGVMHRGGAEQKIRKYLVDNNYIDTIIHLPGNLFFGTSIATDILVMRKSKKDTGVLFINASKECVKVINGNKLTPENIENIVRMFIDRGEIAHCSHLASYDEVVENNYNLSVSTYVEAEDTREKVDIVKLNAEITEIVAKEDALRKDIDTIIREIEVTE